MSDELKNVPVNKRKKAIRRLGVIQDFEQFRAEIEREQVISKREAVILYAKGHDVTRPTLWRWLLRYKDHGLMGLVDNRGGGAGMQISQQAWELFKSMWLDERQLSVKLCRQNICYINKNESKGWVIPRLAAFYRLIDKNIPPAVQVLHREGINAYKNKYAPYVQTDPDSIEPGQIWIGDHCQLNCWVRDRGRWIRPWITAWQDMRSRTIVGFYINSSPNQSTILLAFKRAIEKYGPPEKVKIDNGRDYDSQVWTGTTKARRKALLKKGYIDENLVAGIYAMMDIKVSFAIPYNPQGKGPLERWFDTLDQQFTKTVQTYCGKDTKRRPEALKEVLDDPEIIRTAFGIERLDEKIAKYTDIYNRTVHNGNGMKGRTPQQVINSRKSRRVLAEGVIDLLLRIWSPELKVGKNGVRFRHVYFGQFNSELLAMQGKKVRAAYDPDDLRQLYIYDARTWRLITIADQNRLIGYGKPVPEEALRFAMKAKSRAARIARDYRDTRLTADTNMMDLTMKAMDDAAAEKKTEEPKLLRPIRTPMDGQVREHKRREAVKAVRKAAGAENIHTVLDIDFSALKKDKFEMVDLELFKDDG
ncbi:MAG: hypothetical protein AMJ75_09325 [Phycisphaerae bacterium SM1_79]|nr:MAG: hypothetical protein AMJ75_09325 [Phycisphaerae bacterium SM1_79]